MDNQIERNIELLNADKEAIDRAIDRCEAGGSDNRNASHFDRSKAERQVIDYLDTFTPNDPHVLLEYFTAKADAIEAEEAQ